MTKALPTVLSVIAIVISIAFANLSYRSSQDVISIREIADSSINLSSRNQERIIFFNIKKESESNILHTDTDSSILRPSH